MSQLSNVFLVLGGLSLFLYGVEETSRICRESLSGTAGARITRITSSRVGACFFGVLLSCFSQSSVVATSFALGLVDAGLLPYSGAIIVMMGASAGGMLAMFFFSMNVTAWAPLMLTVSTFAEKMTTGKMQGIARLARGISLIFLGMYVLGLGVRPILDAPVVKETLLSFSNYPFIMGTASLLLTLVLQSSTAVMALAFTLLSSDLLSFADCVPVILGTHLGSSIPVFIASLGGRLNARRLGTLVLLYKVIGVAVFLPFTGIMTHLITVLPVSEGLRLAVVANVIPIVNTLLLLPFAGWLTCLSQRWYTQGMDSIGEPEHLDLSIVAYPDLALPLLLQELKRFSAYLQDFMELLLTTDGKGERVQAFCVQLPSLGMACMRYLRSIPTSAEVKNVLRYDGLLYMLLGMRNLSRVLRKELTPVIKIRQPGTPPLAQRADWDPLLQLLRKIKAAVLGCFEDESISVSSDQLELMEKKYHKLEILFEGELLSKRIATASSRDLETLVALGNLLKPFSEIHKGCEVIHDETVPEQNVKDENSESIVSVL